MGDNLKIGGNAPPRSRVGQEADGMSRGRACIKCSHLKMKCTWPADAPSLGAKSCLRCTRIKIDCQVAKPAPRKRRGNRVAVLEQKVDQLVTLLTSNQAGKESSHTSPLTPTSNSTTENRHRKLSEGFIEQRLRQNASAAANSDVTLEFELFEGFRLTNQEAQRHLELYRNEFVPKFPFVRLSSTMTASDLHQTSHVLFWAIMGAVAPASCDAQVEIKLWFRKYLAHKVLIEQECDLGTLQGVLVHLAWNDFRYYIDIQVSNLLHMALTLVVSLKLDKHPDAWGTTPPSVLTDPWTNCNNRNTSKAETGHTIDEQRAVLGVCHISNLLSILFRRSVTLPWNPYYLQCCDTIAEASTLESDAFLVALMRLQDIASRGCNLIPAPDFRKSSPDLYQTPLHVSLNTVHNEIVSFRDSQPPAIKKNVVFKAYCNTFMLRLYEPVILMRCPPGGPNNNVLAADPLQRAEALWRCLQAAVNCAEDHARTVDSDFASTTYMSASLVGFFAITTTRLLLMESAPGWDLAVARAKFDFPGALACLAGEYEKADRKSLELGRRRRFGDDGTSMFIKAQMKLTWIQRWFTARVAPDTAQTQTQMQTQAQAMDGDEVHEQTEVAISNQENGGGGSGGEMTMDYQFDDSFWQVLFDPALLQMSMEGDGLTQGQL